jgi:hypothetical protein
MRSQFRKIAIGCVLAVAGMPSAAYPQAPAPAAPGVEAHRQVLRHQ